MLKTGNLIRLEANVYSDNLASCKVLERAGFKKEGYIMKAFKKGEIYLDAILYGKVRK